jgi:Protein of unknown function (DUF2490)
MIKRILTVLSIVTLIQKTLIAQSPAQYDAEVWENIYLEKNITPKLVARLNEEGRVTENVGHPSFIYADVGFNYKLNKHVHLALAYVLTQKQQKNETWSTRHQAYFSITLKKKFKNFVFDDRSMFQWQVQDIYSSPTGRYAEYYVRNKFSIKYEKFFKFQPYLAEEVYYYINQPYVYWLYDFNRVRYFAGVYYNTSLINQWELYYLFENNFNQFSTNPGHVSINPQNNYIIGLGYSHTF